MSLGLGSQILLNTATSGINALLSNHQANVNIKRQEKYDDNYYKKYSSPQAQVSNLIKAGLNPNLAYNGLGNASPVTTGSADAAFTPMESADVSSALLRKQSQLLDAQIKNTEEQTEGQKHTNRILDSDASFRDAYNTGLIDMNYSNIQVNQYNNSLTQSQISKTRAETRNINESSKQIVELTKIAQEEGKIKSIEAAFAEKRIQAEINHLLSGTALNYQQVKNLILTGENIKLEGHSIGLQNQLMEIQVESDREFKNLERDMGVIGKVAELIIRAIK